MNLITTILVFCFLSSTAAAEVSVVDVSDFGMTPNDGKDDVRALQKALQACRESGAKRLVFPAGRYDFYPDFAEEAYCFISNNDEGLKRIAFPLFQMEDLTIDGQGSTFMFHGFVNPFVIEGAKSIALENFSIDFSRTFHSEAKIVAQAEEGLILEVSENSPFRVENGLLQFTGFTPAEEMLTTVSGNDVYGSSHILEFDTERRETAFMARDFFFRGSNGYPAKSLGSRRVLLQLPRVTGKAGNTLVFGPNHRNHPGFALTDSEDISFREVTIHHAGGMGILVQRSHNVTVDRCQVTPSQGRMLSTTADATHFVNCTGEIVLSDNLFENQKDDATNIHGIYAQVAERSSEDEIIVQLKHRQQFGFDFLKAGMEVEFVRAKSMITYATARVRSVDRINKEFTKVSFEGGLPEKLLLGDAIAEARDYPEVTIRGNTIRNNRARGMLLNCRGKTVVEDNYFHTPGAAILFEGDSFFWFEQGGVRDCVIRNNVFENCLFGVWGKAVIDVKAGIREEKETSRYNRNIRIENNLFKQFDQKTLLNVYCVEGLVWKNNQVEETEAYPKSGETAERFVVRFSDGVEIE